MKKAGDKNDGAQLDTARLHTQLAALYLNYVDQHCEGLGQRAALDQCGHIDYLAQLIDGESGCRDERATKRRIAQARLPVVKTLEQFDWSWPKKINQMQIRQLFRLAFVKEKSNVVFIGGVGLGKSHFAIALAHAACMQGHTALFTTAIDIINGLAAALPAGGLKREMNKYLKPAVLVIDELGYLPTDKFGADCLFQIISGRYEHNATIITTNRVYKQWAEIFNNDSTLTSALLDRLLHHAETVVISGKSFRMKEQIEDVDA
jgi:DNA replication protein DnaC